MEPAPPLSPLSTPRAGGSSGWAADRAASPAVRGGELRADRMDRVMELLAAGSRASPVAGSPGAAAAGGSGGGGGSEEEWDTSLWTTGEIEASCSALLEEIAHTSEERRLKTACSMLVRLMERHTAAERYVDIRLDSLCRSGMRRPNLPIGQRQLNELFFLAELAAAMPTRVSMLNSVGKALRVLAYEEDTACRILQLQRRHQVSTRAPAAVRAVSAAVKHEIRLRFSISVLKAEWRSLRGLALPSDSVLFLLRLLAALTSDSAPLAAKDRSRVVFLGGLRCLTQLLRAAEPAVRELACHIIIQIGSESSQHAKLLPWGVVDSAVMLLRSASSLNRCLGLDLLDMLVSGMDCKATADAVLSKHVVKPVSGLMRSACPQVRLGCMLVLLKMATSGGYALVCKALTHSRNAVQRVVNCLAHDHPDVCGVAMDLWIMLCGRSRGQKMLLEGGALDALMFLAGRQQPFAPVFVRSLRALLWLVAPKGTAASSADFLVDALLQDLMAMLSVAEQARRVVRRMLEMDMVQKTITFLLFPYGSREHLLGSVVVLEKLSHDEHACELLYKPAVLRHVVRVLRDGLDASADEDDVAIVEGKGDDDDASLGASDDDERDISDDEAKMAAGSDVGSPPHSPVRSPTAASYSRVLPPSPLTPSAARETGSGGGGGDGGSSDRRWKKPLPSSPAALVLAERDGTMFDSDSEGDGDGEDEDEESEEDLQLLLYMTNLAALQLLDKLATAEAFAPEGQEAVCDTLLEMGAVEHVVLLLTAPRLGEECYRLMVETVESSCTLLESILPAVDELDEEAMEIRGTLFDLATMPLLMVVQGASQRLLRAAASGTLAAYAETEAEAARMSEMGGLRIVTAVLLSADLDQLDQPPELYTLLAALVVLPDNLDTICTNGLLGASIERLLLSGEAGEVDLPLLRSEIVSVLCVVANQYVKGYGHTNEAILNAHLIGIVVDMLRLSQPPRTQMAAASLIATISQDVMSSIPMLVEAGVVDALVPLLRAESSPDELKERVLQTVQAVAEYPLGAHHMSLLSDDLVGSLRSLGHNFQLEMQRSGVAAGDGSGAGGGSGAGELPVVTMARSTLERLGEIVKDDDGHLVKADTLARSRSPDAYSRPYFQDPKFKHWKRETDDAAPPAASAASSSAVAMPRLPRTPRALPGLPPSAMLMSSSMPAVGRPSSRGSSIGRRSSGSGRLGSSHGRRHRK
eukprot:PLAT7724.1.p1 GENE.PLAT7724.1~~PLAT7724.1.p1  ORF type:complete len:1207 (+),score=555.51 PLAT7724.1:13-3633(+)